MWSRMRTASPPATCTSMWHPGRITANSLTRSRPPKSMRPPPWPTAWARPWTPPVPTSTIRSTRPMPPPTSMIRVISPCGRLRRTPIPRTPVGRRRLAWAALAGTSNAPPCPTVTWAMASTFTAAAWICASPTTKTKWLRPVRPATPPLRAGCIRHG